MGKRTLTRVFPQTSGWWVAMLLLLLVPPSVRSQDAAEGEAGVWESVRCEEAAEVQAYLERYPHGAHVAEARACLERQLGLDWAARRLVQQGLTALEHAPGPVDGLFGPATRGAISRWQQAQGFAVTGYVTQEQAEALIARGREGAAASGEFVNSVGIEFVLIGAGEFQMGSPVGEAGRDNDEEAHRVRISQPFYLGKYEVTQAQWVAVMGENPSDFTACGDTCPVESVSWAEVGAFISRLNAQEGVAAYRLPTEAEWEYAARAGAQTAIYTGELTIRGAYDAPALDALAWYGGNSAVSYAGGYDCSEWPGRQDIALQCGPHPVGLKRPNGFGLYDMLGNVWEWVADRYEAYPAGPRTDPRGPSSGAYRSYRGGSWDASARNCRVANRSRGVPETRISNLGFRLARTP